MNEKVGLKRRLKFIHVFVLGLALLTPSTVFDTFGIASLATKGHVPLVYMFAMCAIIFTVLSYVQMVKAFPSAGSAYTYVQKTFHPNIGFLVGWSALCDYLFLPMVYALAIKIYMSAYFPSVPEWLWVAIPILLISVANLFNIKVAVSFSTFFVLLQVLISGIFVALLIGGMMNREEAGSLFSLEPLYSANLTFSAVLAGVTILAYSFVGFDAMSTLAEETINPTKTIPRAMIALALYTGITYTVITYFLQASYPDVSIFHDPEAAAAEIAPQIGGMLFASIFLGIIIVSNISGGIAAQLSISRLLYAMGRDNVLPRKIFGYVTPRSGIPIYNIIISGGVALTAVFFDLVTAASLISFGAFTAFTFVNLSVIVYYYVKNKRRSIKETFLYLIFPLIGIGFLSIMWYSMDAQALLLGLFWNTAGFIFLLCITKMFKKSAPMFDFDESEPALIEEDKNHTAVNEVNI
ncbi:APC family permease [Bacillus sp. PK3_68]|uniref:APC family permease n=1 Tax=Bacillus sp. PK3_68 TaxID=2027408 RepID=UPI000E72D9AD|nr:APC family permease [Bacillus sp. PK3_68]RJS59520.1 Putrescine importer PuuP [Bacillus sp. PK3_68]